MVGQRSGVVFEPESLLAPRKPTATTQFRRDRLAEHDRDRAIDLRRTGRVALVDVVEDEEFHPQPSPQSRPWPAAQLSTVGHFEFECHVVLAHYLQPGSLFEQDRCL